MNKNQKKEVNMFLCVESVIMSDDFEEAFSREEEEDDRVVSKYKKGDSIN